METPNRRRLLGGIAATALLLAGRRATAGAPETRWPAVAPPRPRRISRIIRQLGRTRDDVYAWMKFIPPTGERTRENLPASVAEMLTSENAYAEAVLAPLASTRAELLEAILARAPGGASAPPLEASGWLYDTDLAPSAAHPVHRRRRPEGPVEVLVDESRRAEGQPYYRSTGHQPSPDHRYFAWAEDVIGNDRHRIVVRDNATGELRTLVERDAYGYGGLIFSPSSRWLFWIWRDARNRPTRLYRTPVGGGEAELVYEEADAAIFMEIKRTAAGGFIALTLSGPDTAEVRLVPAGVETDPPVVVWPRRPGVRYEIEEWNGGLVALTDAEGAFDMKLVRLDPRDFRPVETVVAHRPGRPILAIQPFAGALARLERSQGLHRLVLRAPTGAESTIDFDDPAYAIELLPGQDHAARSVMIVHQSPKSPRRWISIDLATGAQTVVRSEQVSGFSPDDYEVERVLATAADGESVPITLLSRRGAPRDGSTPLLQYGYGSYGVSSDPEFSLPALALVDRGWRYAIAHVRGGSEKGRRWFLDGRRFRKRNSFTDFIACAEHLCAGGYTAKGRVVAFGLSAGGLLVGASMNLQPTMWGGVIAKVPFVDMLNTMSDGDHPLVPLFRPDWGDPLADTEAYDYIADISPYENVRVAPYPPLLCTAGLKDDRVAYWEPAKLVAEVRHRSTSGAPALLLTDMDSGHQASSNLRTQYAEMALFWAFATRCLSSAGDPPTGIS